MNLLMCIAVMGLLSTSSVSADKPHAHAASDTRPGVEALSGELRVLLVKEMLALQSGMQAIIPAYVSGNWSQIEQIAGNMENSYILKQSLTDAQKEELHTLLPASFIQLDQQFHYLSGMLKHVAEKQKTELVGFYISQLNESCLGCHRQFATHRFPAFEPKQPPAHDEH